MRGLITLRVTPGCEASCTRFTQSVFLFSCCATNVGFASVTALHCYSVISNEVCCSHRGARGLLSFRLIPGTVQVVRGCDGTGRTRRSCVFPVLSHARRGATRRVFGQARGILQGIGQRLGALNRRVKLRVPLAACITQRAFTAILGESKIGVTVVSRSLKRSSLSAARVCLSDFRGDRVSTTVRGLL